MPFRLLNHIHAQRGIVAESVRFTLANLDEEVYFIPLLTQHIFSSMSKCSMHFIVLAVTWTSDALDLNPTHVICTVQCNWTCMYSIRLWQKIAWSFQFAAVCKASMSDISRPFYKNKKYFFKNCFYYMMWLSINSKFE